MGLAQALDLGDGVEHEVVVVDGVLEDGVQLGDDLVDGVAGALGLAVFVGLLGELVAPGLDLLGGDRFDALGAERPDEVGVEDRAVVDLGGPVAREAPVLEPVVGDVGEGHAGALLAARAAPRRASTRISSSAACASRLRKVPGMGAPWYSSTHFPNAREQHFAWGAIQEMVLAVGQTIEAFDGFFNP